MKGGGDKMAEGTEERRFLTPAEGIKAAQERTRRIGEPLEKKFKEGALKQSIDTGLVDGGSSMAPDVSGTGMSPFDAAARRGTLPSKDVSEEDRWSAEKRAQKARRGSSG